MINTSMSVYTNKLLFKGNKKASEHPLTDEALKHAESQEVKNIINVSIKKNATWNEIKEKISELKVTMLTEKDKKALQQFLDAQSEWKLNKKDGTQDVITGHIKSKLRS